MQAFLQSTITTAGDGESASLLHAFDVGGSVYKHIPFGNRVAVTPLAGLSATMLEASLPNLSTQSSLFAFGAHVQGTAHIALGRNRDHVIGISFGVGLYTPAVTTALGQEAQDYHLDRSGRTMGITISYERRFLRKDPFLRLQ
jgi:hypothetical protein